MEIQFWYESDAELKSFFLFYQAPLEQPFMICNNFFVSQRIGYNCILWKMINKNKSIID